MERNGTSHRCCAVDVGAGSPEASAVPLTLANQLCMNPECPWSVPTDDQLTTAPSAVHLWYVRLDVGPRGIDDYWRELSSDERQRGERFHFDRHRDRFVVCRAQLRRVLARYLMMAASEVRFEYEPLGKPKLCGERLACGLHFNLSRSAEIALIAITSERQVGVDVEQIRVVTDAERIAQRFFSPAEHDALSRLPKGERNRAFLKLWTCKEAYLKATGSGLTFPLDQVTISLAGDTQPRIESSADGAHENPWQFASFTPADGFVGAVATPGKLSTITYWYCQH